MLGDGERGWPYEEVPDESDEVLASKNLMSSRAARGLPRGPGSVAPREWPRWTGDSGREVGVAMPRRSRWRWRRSAFHVPERKTPLEGRLDADSTLERVDGSDCSGMTVSSERGNEYGSSVVGALVDQPETASSVASNSSCSARSTSSESANESSCQSSGSDTSTRRSASSGGSEASSAGSG